jgi:hypothetical protein
MKRGEKVGPEIEDRVCQWARDYPGWTQQRIAEEVFRRFHVAIHRSTVGSILARKEVKRGVPRTRSGGVEAVTATEPPPRDLSHLHLHLQGSMHGPGWPSLSTNSQYWVLRVRLENLSAQPLSFGDFDLEVARDIPEDPEVHIYPHIGRDTYGYHGEVPLADEALDKLISLSPDRSVIEGALRFQDKLPFDSDYVRLTLTVKGTGPYRGMEKSWELGRFPSRIC